MAIKLRELWASIGKLPAPVRHAALVLIASLLSWVVTSDPTPGFTTAAATYILGVITPLIQSYGFGKNGSQQ